MVLREMDDRDYLWLLHIYNSLSSNLVNTTLSSSDGSLSMNPRHVSISLVRTSSSGNRLILS